jgi:lipoprotein-anchoring transpeptidase ErfK/SrfK
MRRRVLFFAGAVVLVFAALAAVEFLRAPRVGAISPSPDTFVAQHALTLRFTVKGLSGLNNVVLRLDGQDVTASMRTTGDQIALATGHLTDGEHTADFSAQSGNLFRRHVDRTWRFTVDTTVPHLDLGWLRAKPIILTVPAQIAGFTEPFATVTVSGGAVTASTRALATGAYLVSPRFPEGAATVTFTVRDRAGNQSRQRMLLFVDANPPTLSVDRVARVLRRSRLTVEASAGDTAAAPKLAAVLNGRHVKISGSVAEATVRLTDLPQGINTLVMRATDRGGHVTTARRRFLVNSTEKFGIATLIAGARGKDVVVLQKRLIAAGVLSGKPSAVYDSKTVTAVKKFETKYGLTVDGIVGGRVLIALGGHIVVDLSQLRLYLYSGDRLVKSYPVATGQPAWPTPTGTYAIITMTKDPTWLPPNSDWAKNATPIPPGSENPLGTRWMGTSAPGVGMHGVPPSEDWTIGTYASHGCIRMHNWDAVDLFSRVSLGMPVIIQP